MNNTNRRLGSECSNDESVLNNITGLRLERPVRLYRLLQTFIQNIQDTTYKNTMHQTM